MELSHKVSVTLANAIANLSSKRKRKRICIEKSCEECTEHCKPVSCNYICLEDLSRVTINDMVLREIKKTNKKHSRFPQKVNEIAIVLPAQYHAITYTNQV